MGLIRGSGLLIALQLAAALNLDTTSDMGPSTASFMELLGEAKTVVQGDVSCSKEGDSEMCKCEGRPFGPGNVGDFVHDDYTDHTKGLEYDDKAKSFWDFNAFQNGKMVPMKTFKSKLALVVNVASACGFSNAFYKNAADLLNKYGSKGLTLIAVPANQHGQQAPHSSNCERSILYYKMGMSSFPVLDKVEVNGYKAVGFYKFLKAQKPDAEGGVLDMIQKKAPVAQGELSWNYEKFLVGENGEVVGRYTHQVDVKDLESQIKDVLEKQKDL